MRKFKAFFLLLIVAVPLMALASVTVTVNGSNHTIPQTNERGWGNAVTAWIQAISTYTLQPTGGSFPLTADIDFGSSYGLKSSYLSTRTANPSSAGLLRLSKTDTIGWRNNANGGNLLLGIDGSDNLTFNGNILATTSSSGFTDSGFFVVDASDATKKMGVNAGGTTGTTTTLTFNQTANRAITFPDFDATLSTLSGTETLTNKTLTSPVINSPTGIVKADVGLGNVDNTSDATKNAATAIITNKTINGSDNTITNVSLTSGVTGTLPIANGGTGQTTANAALNALSPLTTKGDLLGFSTVNARLPVGTNGQAIVADSTQTLGVKWADVAVTTQGQDEGSSVSTTALKAPHNQLTTTGTNERLIETGNGNLLANPSFEHSSFATGWSALGDTTPSVETSEVRHGKKAVKLTLNAQSGIFWSQSVTPTIKMSGMTLEHGINVKTSLTGIKVCALNAGASVGTCSDVLSDNVWHYYPITYPGPSSGSVGVGLYHATGATGDVYVDDAYVGDAWGRSVGTVAQAKFIGSLKYAGTANCAWTSSSTSLAAFSADTDCPTASVVGSATSPGTKIPGAVFSNLAPGTYKVTVKTAIGKTGTQDAIVAAAINDGTTTGATQTFYNFTNNGTVVAPLTLVSYFTYTTTQSSVTYQVYGYSQNASNAVTLEAGNTNRDFEIAVEYIPSVSSGTTAVNLSQLKAPTIQKFTSGSGTYTTPAGVTHIKVRMVGGGGGGGGSGTASIGNGGAGGNTTFGTSLLTANGGGAGTPLGSNNAGGTVTVNSPAVDFGSRQGASGQGATYNSSSTVYIHGGDGGVTPLGGAGGGSTYGAAGVAAIANTGSGGGGAGGGSTAGTYSGGGGGAGGYVEAMIISPSATYSYAVGAAGTAGTAGTNGSAGGAGGSGYIEVTEYYAYNMPLIAGGVTSGSSGVTKIIEANLNCDAGSAITSQSGGISAIGNRSTTSCAVTLTTGFFSATPYKCSVTANASTVQAMSCTCSSATSCTIYGPSADYDAWVSISGSN